MGKRSIGSKPASGGSHHCGSGPKTDVPHHMGPKKEQESWVRCGAGFAVVMKVGSGAIHLEPSERH